MSILSIQSHVAYGYVGNRAAVFPLQSLGYDVWQVNTVQFSNHTGYGNWTGMVFDSKHIKDVIFGLKNLGLIKKCRAILSGYLGDSEIGNIILETLDDWRKINPNITYLCDPVIGDFDRKVYVRDGILEFFKSSINKASIITPNHFEAEILTGMSIKTLSDAKIAVNKLHDLGIKIILITSLNIQDIISSDSITRKKDAPDNVYVLLSDRTEGGSKSTTDHISDKIYIGKAKYYDFADCIRGTGDLFSSLFLGYYLEQTNAAHALERTLYAINNIVNKTWHLGNSELFLFDYDYKSFISNAISIEKY